ncbi:SET domain-containing protein [Thalassomonas actiniarum]|uniref:SET domain-containing protein n=1 Tax=Thalassomonas actiniarum TaxID=485447 RepID=A0AAF0C108_9GAMM|nr:SET domain-containing protein [Thalassomonas actiniarum]WDD96593.1 SET domain-containing protein [Thalassomonas actiniarum]
MLVTKDQVIYGADHELSNWLSSAGIDTTKLVINTSSDGERRLVAAYPLMAGEKLLTLPQSHLMGGGVARQSDIGEKLLQAGIKEGHALLSAYLLQENNRENSFWAPYLEMLPAHFNHIPLFYSTDMLCQLQGSPVIEMILMRRFTLEQDYHRLRELPEMKDVTLVQYMWARTVINSRCFTLNGEVVLGPLLDMANHMSRPNSLWQQNKEKNALVLVSQDNIAAGEEITVSYGRKSNRRLFASYGFVHDDSRFNSARITVSLDVADSLIAEKIALMEIENYALDIDIGPGEPEGFLKALMFLRISTSKCLQSELSCYQKPRTRLDEILALQAFLQTCQQMLALYDSNEVTQVPQRGGQNIADCKKFLAQEKQTLKHYVSFVSTALTFLTHGKRIDYIQQELETRYQRDLLALFEEEQIDNVSGY